MTRVVTFGELMLRLSPPGFERLLQQPLLRTWFGGAEANVAVSLSHFGIGAAFVTRLPDSPLGEAAIAALRADGVDVSHIQRGGERLGLYFVEQGVDLRPMRVVYDRAGSAFSAITAETFAWADILQGTEWLHLSGITPALGAGPAAATRHALDAARGAQVRISLDLNYRPALWSGRDPVPVIRPLATGCDLLIGNRPAIAAMLGIESEGEDPLALARVVTDAVGCRRMALTQREQRSASVHCWTAALYDGEADRLTPARSYTVQVVDRVGGGDSFAAALLFALLDGRPDREAVEFATASSALKLTVPGDANRVTVAEVDRFLQSRT